MKDLTYKDLIEILSAKCYVSDITMERMIQNFVLLIASELQNNSYIKIKNIGKFSVEQKGGCDEWIQNDFGTMRKKYVEPFKYINFEPSQNLIDVVNGESLNYLFKKTKEKFDKPTPYEEILESRQIKDNMSDAVKKILTKHNDKNRKKAQRIDNGEYLPIEKNNLGSHLQTIQTPILCKNNNVVYPSIFRAANDLGIANTTLREHTIGRIRDMKCKGYEFEWVREEDKEKYKRED
jgi:nucleoid DNA-binding protein